MATLDLVHGSVTSCETMSVLWLVRRLNGMYLVDSHVHLHACFDRSDFLDSASANLRRVAKRLNMQSNTPGVLLFTQSQGTDVFGNLRVGTVGGWSISETGEPVSLRATNEDRTLYLVAGRQIVAREGLEVLAFGSTETFADGQPIETTIDAVLKTNGVPAIPWGFGKWSGARKKVVQRLARDSERFPLLFFGDNAGRLALASRPHLFEEIESLCRAILPGTDPLPFSHEFEKVGRLAFVVDNRLSPKQPFESLRSWLAACDETPKMQGEYEHLGRFLQYQLALQFRKRLGANG